MSEKNKASTPLYHQFLDQWLNLGAELRDHIHQDVQKGYEIIAPFNYGSTQTYGLYKPVAKPSESAMVFYGGDDFADFKGMIETAKAYANEIGTNSFIVARTQAEKCIKEKIEADVWVWMEDHVPPLVESLNKSEDDMDSVYRPYVILGLEQMAEHYEKNKDKAAHDWTKALLHVSVNYTAPALTESTAATRIAREFSSNMMGVAQKEEVVISYKKDDIILVTRNEDGEYGKGEIIDLLEVMDTDTQTENMDFPCATVYNTVTHDFLEVNQSSGRIIVMKPDAEKYVEMDDHEAKLFKEAIIGVISGTVPEAVELSWPNNRYEVKIEQDESALYLVKIGDSVRGAFKKKEQAEVYDKILKSAREEGYMEPYMIRVDEWETPFNEKYYREKAMSKSKPEEVFIEELSNEEKDPVRSDFLGDDR